MARHTSTDPAADDPSAGDPSRVITRLRADVAELAARRDAAARAAGAALVTQAEVRQALVEQRRALDAALAQVERALTLARRVADDVARDDGEPAAAPYRANADGLATQRDVVAAARAQLVELEGVSREHVAAARGVIVTSRAEFDRALHEQLRLLASWERLERARLVLAARAARGTGPSR